MQNSDRDAPAVAGRRGALAHPRNRDWLATNRLSWRDICGAAVEAAGFIIVILMLLAVAGPY